MKNNNGPGSRQWRQMITEGAGELGVQMTAAQAETLACHAAELIRWNRKINLTRISDPGEMAIKHYVDSLACVPYLSVGGHVLDIGSGGGFPGIPVAVAGQAVSVLMIDSVGKKVSFLQHAIRLMGLENAQARHLRAEDLMGRPEGCERFDRVVCRALTALERIVDLAFPLLKPGGIIVALKGRTDRTDQECRRLERRDGTGPGEGNVRSVVYRLPVLNVERNLILIQKPGFKGARGQGVE